MNLSMVPPPPRTADARGWHRPVERCHPGVVRQFLLTVRKRSSVSGEGIRPVTASETTIAGGELEIGIAGRNWP